MRALALLLVPILLAGCSTQTPAGAPESSPPDAQAATSIEGSSIAVEPANETPPAGGTPASNETEEVSESGSDGEDGEPGSPGEDCTGNNTVTSVPPEESC